MSGRLIGDLALIEPGCTLYAKGLRRQGGWDGADHKGGTVIDTYDSTDSDTGEIVRTWIVIEPWRGRIACWHINEDQVDRDGVTGPDAGHLRKLVRQCARELCDHTAGRKGVFTNHDAAVARAITVLTPLLLPGVTARWEPERLADTGTDGYKPAPANVAALCD